jgi:integrase
VLPIATQMAAALAAWPRIRGRDCLFGNRSPHGFTNWDEAKQKLDASLKFNRPFVLHDIRRTVETRLAELGVNKEVRSRILNHDVGELQESYQHYSFEAEKRGALQRWSDQIDHIVS